jgi:hypothetical protein
MRVSLYCFIFPVHPDGTPLGPAEAGYGLSIQVRGLHSVFLTHYVCLFAQAVQI